MPRSWYVCGLLICTGCTALGSGHLPARGTLSACPSGEGADVHPGSCARGPECKPEEVHVEAPCQKVVVKRPAAAAPAALPTAAVPSPEVLLVPRTVYLPYGPQVPIGPARMVPLQTTPVQPTTMVPVLPGVNACGSDPNAAASLAQTQKRMEELAQQLQALEGSLQQLNQAVAQKGAPAAAPVSPVPRTQDCEWDRRSPNR